MEHQAVPSAISHERLPTSPPRAAPQTAADQETDSRNRTAALFELGQLEGCDTWSTASFKQGFSEVWGGKLNRAAFNEQVFTANDKTPEDVLFMKIDRNRPARPGPFGMGDAVLLAQVRDAFQLDERRIYVSSPRIGLRYAHMNVGVCWKKAHPAASATPSATPLATATQAAPSRYA